MSRNLVYIKADFCGISKSITRLETVVIPLCDAIKIVKQTESELSLVEGEVTKLTQNYKVCLNEILDVQLCVKFLTFYVKMKQNLAVKTRNFCQRSLFKYSPVTSCDKERSFSRYKVLLSDNRRSFQFDDFKMHVIIHFNTTENEG
jgi:hypothetical protein